MAEPLKNRTRRLLLNYLLFRAREPGAPELQPTSGEAWVLRWAATWMMQRHQTFFSTFRGYQGNRVELLSQLMDILFSDPPGLTWGRVVAVVAFAGTLLEQDPLEDNNGKRRLEVVHECLRMVDLLCDRLTEQHGAWLEAQDGWDGFCRYLNRPLPPSFWRKLLLQMCFSCFFGMLLLYWWKRL